MKIKDIYRFLDKLCPFNTAQDFDNVGLLIGDMDSEVSKAIVALDCTRTVADLAIENGAQLIITHHPLIFEGLKSIPLSSLYADLIKHNISVISAHTNLDIAVRGVNDCLAQALKLKGCEKLLCEDGFSLTVGETERPMAAEEFADYIARCLNTVVRFSAGGNIKKVAVCGGAGGEFADYAFSCGADAFVTGEAKHHQLLSAAEKGKALIDCGHFASEDVVIEPLTAILRDNLANIQFIPCHNSAIKNRG